MWQLATLRRERLVAGVLVGWAVMWFVVMAVHGGGSWHFFVDGATALADLDDTAAGGLHLYAAAPVLQIGPVALLAALPLLAAGPPGALFAVQVLGAAAGLVIVRQIRQVAGRIRPNLDRHDINLRVALAALYLLPVWMYLAVSSAHLDDVLALLGTIAAAQAACARRPVLTGLLLGLAVDAKPWALAFAALLLIAGDRRGRLLGLLTLAATVTVAWLPFLLADPGTMRAVHYTIPNTQLSALRVFGVHDPRTPSWARPAQLLLGLALGVVAVRRGRWAAVPLLAVMARVVLDPGTNRYYVAGIVVGAALWDVAGSRAVLPWWTIGAGVGLFTSRFVPMPDRAHGWLTVAYFAACCGLVLAPRGWTDRAAAAGVRWLPPTLHAHADRLRAALTDALRLEALPGVDAQQRAEIDGGAGTHPGERQQGPAGTDRQQLRAAGQ
ncbi:glycosyltransferase 87 family protein [Dactylosporangium sp. NPDC006015]|uniref:glycosyltransferase 87 family protein n=1 Tax=Dactylosporangium sp. NPDC006015 TaxID=3154576 RepID=UPI0033B66AFA